MAVLKRHEKNPTLLFIYRVAEKIKIPAFLHFLFIVSATYFFTFIIRGVPYTGSWWEILLISVWILLLFLCLLGFLLKIFSKIFFKKNNKWNKFLENMFNDKKETLVIVAKDRKGFKAREFAPTLDGQILYLIAYLNLRWGKGNYSILYTDSHTDIIKALQNKIVENVYFYGHGARATFENYGLGFYYELLRLVEHKKKMVIQLTCCNDDKIGCAADYLLEGKNKENYQAGTVINTSVFSFNSFYKKDLVENGIYKNKKFASRKIKEEVKRIKKNTK